MKMLTVHTDIHEAAFSGDFKLLKSVLDSNRHTTEKKNEYEQTSLHKAAMAGWLPCVKLLIEKGANADALDVAGCTPLHYASGNGYLEIARCLVEEGNARTDIKSNKGYNAQSIARSRGQIRVIAFFNEMQNKTRHLQAMKGL